MDPPSLSPLCQPRSCALLFSNPLGEWADEGGFLPSLWLHVCSGNISQVLCFGDNRLERHLASSSPTQCAERQALRDRLARPHGTALYPVYPFQCTRWSGQPSARAPLGNSPAMQGRLLEAALCHRGQSLLTISRLASVPFQSQKDMA